MELQKRSNKKIPKWKAEQHPLMIQFLLSGCEIMEIFNIKIIAFRFGNVNQATALLKLNFF